jgi:hypothetical protein
MKRLVSLKPFPGHASLTVVTAAVTSLVIVVGLKNEHHSTKTWASIVVGKGRSKPAASRRRRCDAVQRLALTRSRKLRRWYKTE